jgi:hypothetical protein
MRKRNAAIAAASCLGLVVAGSATASTAKSPAAPSKPASVRTQVFRADLESLNDSGATGVAKLRLKGRDLNIRIDARGLAPNLVHAQHIHGVGNSECPPPEAAGADGILSTTDGAPFYGPIVSSLTTSGDTSPAAGLSIEIMPKADSRGEIHYRRTITLAPKVAANLGAFQIVEHGVDFNANHAYDFGAGVSDLNPAFPQEATAPANCGTIEPQGGHHH